MADTDVDAEFDKAFEGFGEEPKQPESPKDTPVAPADNNKPKEGEDDANKAQPTDKPDDTTKPDDKGSAPADGDKPAGETKDGGDEGKPATDGKEDKPTDSNTQPASEEPKPLTKDDVTDIIRNIQTDERSSVRQLQETTNEVLEAYYPDGLSNVLVDQATGKELKTPQDVMEVSDMDIEQATQWLMNEQYALDKDVAKIKDDAEKIAETTINFKRDSVAAIQKYEPLFKWQPTLQQKVFDLLMKNVRADEKKGVILSAPDVTDLYDTYLEPYQKAYEFATNTPATNPNPPAPEPPKPSADDRLDEGGDGGSSDDSDDPNDFAQQVSKELAKGM